ncbi:MAG: sigma-70 family RNA polymerase sigma factor [Clostridia bacterium]|nr:sigma-70 family RNA polymerase sigma factor [Clostridia bacterium]
MLGIEETLMLIKKAQSGSESAKTILLENNYPLIKSIVKRFLNKGIEYDDLYQLGCVGFLKAINNFNEQFNVKFSTYCVPMVIGEIKRFMRDDGIVKVSRTLKTLNFHINKFVNNYKNENNGESPNVETIAKELKMDTQEIVLAIESSRQLISLNDNIDDESSSCSIGDKVPCEESIYEDVDFIMLKSALNNLDERDKKLIILRYFRNKTQSEVAQALGVSQVQVSRLENKILSNLRSQIAE